MKTPLPHSRSSLLETALGLGCILAASLSSARAASDTWDGGGADGNWQTTTNWAADTQFPGTNANVFTSLDDATFGATTGAALNLGTTLNLRSLVYGVAGGDAGSFTVGDADDVLNFTTAGGATINAGVTTGQSIGVAGTIINLSTAANSTTTLANNGTGLLTVAGNVVAVPPAGNSLLTVTGSGNTAISGAITETGAGGSALLKTGSGTLTLSGGSVFSGNAALGRIPAAAAGFPLVVREGTLLLDGGTHAPDGEIVIGGVVADGGAGQNARIQVDSGTFNVNSWLSVGRGNGVGGSISELVANNGAIIQAVNFSAGFNGGNAANLPNTAITLNGTSAMTVTSNNSNFHVAESPGSRCVITLNGSSMLTRNGAASGTRIGMTGTGVLDIASPTASANVRNLIIGQGANGVGAAYNKGTLLGLPDGLFLGDGGGSASYFRNDNGTAPTPNATAGTIAAAIGANSNAVVDVVSGSITGTRVIAGAFNNNSNNAQYNVTGGTLGTGATGFQVGDNNTRINKWANVNVTGSGQFTNPTTINLSLANNAANTAILSVAAGGTVTADTITAAGAALAYVNFHNGTLQASAGTTASLVNNVDRLTVHSGGMTIHTNGFNKNLDAVIASPDADGTTTFGVTSVSLSGTGTGYEGRPVVKITGGGGTGATAMADFNPATGEVTGVTLTSPGSGYTSAPTVTVAGGGGTALTATAAIGAVSGGGLTKTGGGTLTLTQANTFTGPIVINGGKLAFGGTYAANAVSVGAAGTLQVAQPASPVGTLTVPTLSLTSGATLELETNGVTSDKIVVTTPGGLSLGTLGINLYESGTTTPALAGTSTVFEYTTSFTGGTGGMSILNPRPGFSYAFNDSGSAITVTATAVDSDGDGMTDIYEIANGLDPNDNGSINPVNGASGNLDGDFATNLEEFIAGTGANNALDDPLNTDNDGLPDAYEVANFGNTTSQTGATDYDGDFDSNLLEFTNGTAANSAASFSDTDADGLGDGWEIEYFTTIATKDGTLDSDGDLFTDLEEYQYGSNPNDSSFSPAFAKLKHRWSFTNNLVDSVGTSDATIENLAGTNVVTQNATSVTFAGGAKAASQWVKLGSNLLPSRNTPCTIQLWATYSGVQNWSRVFDFHNSTAETLFMSWSVAGTNGTDRVGWVDAANLTSDNTNGYLSGTTKYHIVMTIEPSPTTPGSSLVKWYSAPEYDGVTNLAIGAPRGSATVANSLALMNDAINAIGYSAFADNAPNATYDEVRIWDGALPQWAIQGLHEQGADNATQPDSDTDGLPDAFEEFYFGDGVLVHGPASNPDSDSGTNLEELLAGSDPNNALSDPFDTDLDGLPDAWELSFFDDLDETAGGDPDGDFALNSEELSASTDPSLYTSFPDVDNDGMSDAWETFYVGNLSDNGSSDTDGDNLNLLAEFVGKSLPNDPLSPGAADGDADNDGLPDRWETAWFGATTLATANGAGDADSDGATNLAEYEATSDPLDVDSTPTDVNGDGTPDQHVFHGFNAPGSGVQDKDGEATPFTTRLANSGTTIPSADPNLDLDTTAGTLALTTSSSDINGQVNMAGLEALGIPLSSLGFTGNQDFRIRAHYVNLPALGGFDQIGAYVGTSTTSMTRAAAIGGNYQALGVNTAAANDSAATFGAAGTAGAAGRDLTVIIQRIGGVWSMSCNDNASNPGAQPAFLDGNGSLQAGIFVLDQNVHKTAVLESFTAVSFGASSPDADDDGMDDAWEIANFGNTGRDGTLDFDFDGVSDLAEFAFNGNPSSGSSLGTITSALLDTNANGQKELTLTVAVRSGATFATGVGGARVATVNGVTYTIRGSLDLTTFTSAVSHVGSTASGDPDYDLHTFRLDASEGLPGKGFLQAVATHP
jgi:autotransporter-associated beta strand protein